MYHNLQLKNPLREGLDGVWWHFYFYWGLSPDSCSCSIPFKFLGAHLQWKKWSPKPSTMISMCAACRYTCFYRLSWWCWWSYCLVFSPCIDVFTMMLQMDRFCEKGNALESQFGNNPASFQHLSLLVLNRLIQLVLDACQKLLDSTFKSHNRGQIIFVLYMRRNTLMPMHCSDLAGDPVMNRCIGFTLDNLASTMFR